MLSGSEREALIGRDPGPVIDLPTGPNHPQIDRLSGAETKVQIAKIAACVTAANRDFANLRAIPCGHFDKSTDCIPVRPRSPQSQQQPVATGGACVLPDL